MKKSVNLIIKFLVTGSNVFHLEKIHNELFLKIKGV